MEDISVIIPVYNEETTIGQLLRSLRYFKDLDIVIVDGGSTDKTASIAKDAGVRFIKAEKGRASQMNKGAKYAERPILMFLHADTWPGAGSLRSIKEYIDKGFIGGCLTQEIDSTGFIYKIIQASGNIRARFFKIFYGDQAIFVKKDIFLKIGCFDEVEFFEDILLSRKLKRVGKTCVLSEKIYTSKRRWEKQGIVKTTLINWLMRCGFLLQIPAAGLKKIYKDIR